MNSPRSVAVLGCGMIVRRAHLPGLLGHGARVPVLFGPDSANSRALAAEFGVANLVHDLDDVFATPGLDAAVIALPNFQHAPAALAAIEAGLPILLEKPIASDIASARRIIAEAEAHGVPIAMSLPHRQRPSLIRLRSLIGQGALGRIESIDIRMTRRAGIPGFGGWFTDRALAGGGPLMDMGPHVLDTAFRLAGSSRVIRSESRLWSSHGPRGRGLGGWGNARRSEREVFDVEDRAWFTLDLDTGAKVTGEVAWAQYGPNESYLRVVGDRGGADYAPDRPGHPLRVYRDDAAGRPADHDEPIAPDHDPLDAAWLKVAGLFVEELRGAPRSLVSGAEALVAAEVIAQLYAGGTASG